MYTNITLTAFLKIEYWLLSVWRLTLVLGKSTERLDITGRQSRPRHLFFAVSSFRLKKSLILSFNRENSLWSPLDPQDEHHGLLTTFRHIYNFFSIAIFHTYNQDIVFLDGEWCIKIILFLFMSFKICMYICMYGWDKMLQSKNKKKSQTSTICIF